MDVILVVVLHICCSNAIICLHVNLNTRIFDVIVFAKLLSEPCHSFTKLSETVPNSAFEAPGTKSWRHQYLYGNSATALGVH